jgi:hypothetical protein
MKLLRTYELLFLYAYIPYLTHCYLKLVDFEIVKCYENTVEPFSVKSKILVIQSVRIAYQLIITGRII